MSLTLLSDLSNKQIILYNKIKTDVDKMASTSQAKVAGFNDAQFPSMQDRVQVSQLNFLIRSFLEVFNYLDDLRDQMQSGFQNLSLSSGQLAAYSQKTLEEISSLKNNITRLENQIGLKPISQIQPIVTPSPEIIMTDKNTEKDWNSIKKDTILLLKDAAFNKTTFEDIKSKLDKILNKPYTLQATSSLDTLGTLGTILPKIESQKFIIYDPPYSYIDEPKIEKKIE